MSPRANLSLGFDTNMFDFSRDKNQQIEAAWAFYTNSLTNPVAWGQIILRRET
ncbi:MAG: hypothetical protein NC911_06195 [Candidatus Omnitrophica bacterium]|nr:hypothetical protein [Candidatus Omnitrophota bacterium]